MRMIVLGPEVPPPLAAALADEGVETEQAPQPEPQGESAVAELTAALRATERALDGSGAACALITGAGDAALGAALTAVKLGIPSAWLAPADAVESGELTGRVADLTVDATADPGAGARAIRELGVPTMRSP